MAKIYCYIRCSKDSSDTANQRFQLQKYLNENLNSVSGLDHALFYEETITGTSYAEDRELGKLIDKLQPGDTVLLADVSRMGRTTLDVMESGSRIVKKKARLIFLEPFLELKDDIGSEVMFFGLALGARIQRDFISASTKRALARKKAEGMTLGRPLGSTSAQRKLDPHLSDIKAMLKNKVSKSAIARTFKASRNTLDSFIKFHKLD